MKKKVLIVFALPLMLVSLAFAGWTYRDSKPYDFTSSVSITNTASRAFRISGIQCYWSSATTSTTSVYRVRSFVPSYGTTNIAITKLLRSYPVTSATTLFITGADFESFAFKKDDILIISDNSGVGVTNYMDLDTEAWQ